MLQDTMDPSEVDFLGEKQLVTIMPNFKEGRVYLISVSKHKYVSWRLLLTNLY